MTDASDLLSQTPISSSDTDAQPGRQGRRLYFLATLLSQASALIRYIVLARLLGPEQLGLVATLVVTGSFFDLISDTGADRFLVQDRYGDTTRVQKLAQLVLVGRGIAAAAALVIFAAPLAAFYHAPPLVSGFVVLAISPLVLGFLHLDVRRTQRNHDFRLQAQCMIGAESAGLLATIAAAWIVRDFTSILYGLITRATVMVLISHLRAQRRYGFGWDLKHGARMIRFGAPLMLNGLMLFMASQGDRVIIGNQLGARTLGLYSATILLIYYPAVLLGSYINAVYVPQIAEQRDAVLERDKVINLLAARVLMIAAFMACGFALVAPHLAPFLFGSTFAQSALLVGLIGILQSTRFVFGLPVTAALAIGRSSTVLASNLVHMIAFACGFVGLRLLGGLVGVVFGFVGGEFVALGLSLMLLNRELGRDPLYGFDRLLAFALTCGVIVGWNFALGSGLWSAEACMLVLSATLVAWLWRKEPALRAELGIAARRLVHPLAFGFKRH